MSLTLRRRASIGIPVDGSPIKPETFRGRSPSEAARVPLRLGNATAELGELFDVSGDAGDDRLTVEGDLSDVAAIGRELASGTLVVRGDVGPRFAAGMSGGEVELHGSCGDWAGAEMSGGLLRIRGSAGDGLAAAFPGSRRGMREGIVLVEGDAGADVGLMMRRGLIAVRGSVGPLLGRGMIAGTIVACGAVGASPGVGMRRGTLVLAGLDDDGSSLIPPTFARAGCFAFPFLRMYRDHLAGLGFELPRAVSSARFERYNGDLAGGGQGEVLIPSPSVVSPA
ncbi:formylmethanofuran dehydrogenase subunit C [Paludisphaera sp.]|uniref:formylmethanofuran dehydrogenase subunit C n=1 Tax=Paludisphaera sp. TaxID=2017432 RepID=UPI00301B7B0C